jgi:hypothetical protein
MDVRFKKISYTKVDPGLIKHSPSSKHTPLLPYASEGGIMAWTFWPTTIRATISSRPGMTDPEPSLNSNEFDLPSAWVASKIYENERTYVENLFPGKKIYEHVKYLGRYSLGHW